MVSVAVVTVVAVVWRVVAMPTMATMPTVRGVAVRVVGGGVVLVWGGRGERRVCRGQHASGVHLARLFPQGRRKTSTDQSQQTKEQEKRERRLLVAF